eukprot:Gb_38640 [translate_table: standard]
MDAGTALIYSPHPLTCLAIPTCGPPIGVNEGTRTSSNGRAGGEGNPRYAPVAILCHRCVLVHAEKIEQKSVQCRSRLIGIGSDFLGKINILYPASNFFEDHCHNVVGMPNCPLMKKHIAGLPNQLEGCFKYQNPNGTCSLILVKVLCSLGPGS